jgi:cytochrome P450
VSSRRSVERNRGPDVFTAPHVFDIARVDAKDYLTFSGGRHFCVGAASARMEGESPTVAECGR